MSLDCALGVEEVSFEEWLALLPLNDSAFNIFLYHWLKLNDLLLCLTLHFITVSSKLPTARSFLDIIVDWFFKLKPSSNLFHHNGSWSWLRRFLLIFINNGRSFLSSQWRQKRPNMLLCHIHLDTWISKSLLPSNHKT